MKYLPAARRRFALNARLEPGHGLAGVGLLLALLAGCGAGGKDNGRTVGTGNGGAPSGGSSGFNPGDPILGDGCIGASCELAGDPLLAPAGCGNGTLTADEACDDGNRNAGDGCAEHCLATEPGFSCASPGQACRQIARCGDGIVAPTEQCDDANVAAADGCSARCRVELGKKCDGEPSVCTDAICGNGDKEGAESCDDGNITPFDGCSPSCLTEPNCEGEFCVSDCGDGLLINEACDDGNVVDGDGCSSACTQETGFTCIAAPACDTAVQDCVLRVPAIFRDFSNVHPDFGNNGACTALVVGAVQDTLDVNRRPVMSGLNAAQACLSNQANFSNWYTSGANNVPLVSEIVLYDNGENGYVNRYGANGEQFLGINQTTPQRGYSPTLAGCAQVCANEAANETQCFNECDQFRQDVQQTQNLLNQRTNELNQAIAQNNAAQQAALEPVVAQLTLDLEAEQVAQATCQTTCAAETTRLTTLCSDSCAPCQNNPQQFCSGGEAVYFDGNPLFFPVDSVTGPTAITPAPATATVPDQYGWNGFPDESVIFPGRPSYNHNFYFTSEVQYWFKYEANTAATLTFLGDDDVWVFLNGRLAVDLGGVHVPSTGTLTIDAAQGAVNATMQDGRGFPVYASPQINRNRTTDDFGLLPGNVYLITIFHAERQQDGSSFQLTLAGFEATPSECTAICDDGILSFGEECDDGVNDGGYGECAAGCVLGPFCGDNIVQAEEGESCDVGPRGDGTCRGCRRLQIQ